jgi:hypothetical protein
MKEDDDSSSSDSDSESSFDDEPNDVDIKKSQLFQA